MQSASAKWNDDRLDALKADIDRQFERFDEDSDRLKAEMRDGFSEIRAQLRQLNINMMLLSVLYGASILALFGAVLLRG